MSAASYPGVHFDNWDSASKRRYNVSQTAPRAPRGPGNGGSEWDPPSGWNPSAGQSTAPQPAVAAPAPTPNNGGGAISPAGSWGTTSSTGNPLLDTIQHNAMQNYGGAIQGARLAAADSMGNDPQAAGFASLSSMIGGQGNMARSLGDLGSQWAIQKDSQANSEHMMRLQQQLEEEAYKREHANDWIGALAGAGGKALGAWAAPGGWWGGN